MGIWRFGRDYLEGGTGRYSSNISDVFRTAVESPWHRRIWTQCW